MATNLIAGGLGLGCHGLYLDAGIDNAAAFARREGEDGIEVQLTNLGYFLHQA